MLRVALTGGIASGKSAVAERFQALGALVIDADRLARFVVQPGMPAFAAIRERFGPDVAPAGGLDRKALGAIVFGDERARADLNAIVHPEVRRVADELEAQVSDPYAIVVHDIPLLVEAVGTQRFDAVVVVDVPEELQRERLAQRDRLSAVEVGLRLRAQASREDRLRVADYVVANTGSLDELDSRVHAVWDALLRLRAGVDRGCH